MKISKARGKAGHRLLAVILFLFLPLAQVRSQQPTLLGDLDADGRPTVIDLQRLLNHINASSVLSLSLAPYGVRVNAVGPGPVVTPMVAAVVGSDGAAMEKVLSRIPMGRLGQPEEIAAIAAFLASDDASYVTGQPIFADGGRLALGYFAEPWAPPA